jgi:hypothetical protein
MALMAFSYEQADTLTSSVLDLQVSEHRIAREYSYQGEVIAQIPSIGSDELCNRADELGGSFCQ